MVERPVGLAGLRGDGAALVGKQDRHKPHVKNEMQHVACCCPSSGVPVVIG